MKYKGVINVTLSANIRSIENLKKNRINKKANKLHQCILRIFKI